MKIPDIISKKWLVLFLFAVFMLICLAILEAVKPLVTKQIECSKDSDCATGGCSGQVCTTAEKAPSIITTCEYLPEYDCLKKTSCGCVSGKCEWKKTQEYLDCMKGLEK